MKLLYHIFIQLMVFGMRAGSLFHDKLKRGWEGRRKSCDVVKQKLSPDDRVIWMHAASLGEYLQGLPVLDLLKVRYPDHKILITFFSPSGYENAVRKDKAADVLCYLPFDRRKDLENFMSFFTVDLFFTVKYDYWYNLLALLTEKGAKNYVISAYFYETQVFFKPYGKWFVKQLQENIRWLFHQTVHSTALAKSIGLKNSSTSGDTRFDRVKQNLENDNHVNFIQQFKDGKKTVVFGSSWQAEERIAEIISRKNQQLKLIIAPHDLKRVEGLKEIFPDALLYSTLRESSSSNIDSIPSVFSQQVLIIDCIGLLSKLYSYADLAVVGGGFHSAGLHNILEAAVFGIPVVFGNHYRKNPEADGLIRCKGAVAVEDEFFAAQYILSLLGNPELLETMGNNASGFIRSQPHAAQITANKIMADFSN